MIKYLSIIFLSIISFSQAQYLVEDFDVTENNAEFGVARIDFNFNPKLEHYKISCPNPIYAHFPNGEEAFKKELSKNMSAYLDSGQYAVNGNFYLILNISSQGKVDGVQLSPKVQNGDMLAKDIEFSVRKIKTHWNPATCDNQPIASKVRLKISFGTEDFDR